MNSKADLEKENAKAELEKLKINMATDQLVELIADMFPVFVSSIGMRLSYDSSQNFLIKKQRIEAKDKFDRYFVFDINNRQISRSEISDLNNSISENQAESFLKSAASNNQVTDNIHEIRAFMDEINQERCLVLAGALIKSIHTFHVSAGDLIVISVAWEAEALMLDLLENVKDPKERYLFIKAVISEANENTIGVVASIVHHIAMGIGRIKSDNGDRYHFIDASEQFDEIWGLYVKKIKESNQRKSILTVFKSRLVLMLIKWVDDDQYCTLVKELLAKDTNLLRFVCMHVQSYASERFEADELEDVTRFASEAEIRQIISNCMRDDRFEELSAEDQNKAAAFILLKNTAVVSKQDCENLLKKWKTAG